MSRWKLFDNLRRSLVPAALTLLLLLGWTVFSSPWFWTLVVLGVLLIPPLLATLPDVLRKPGDMRLGQHFAAVASAAGQRAIQAVFFLVTLPHEAFYSMDAILRTLVRLLVTQQRLLEWTPSGNVQGRHARNDLAASSATWDLPPCWPLARPSFCWRPIRPRLSWPVRFSPCGLRHLPSPGGSVCRWPIAKHG